ncbi:hypothetical protein ABVT39_010187 [Epinephelus coioides]
MVKIVLSVNSSDEILDPREQIVEENDADSFETDQKTVSDEKEELLDLDWTSEDMTDHYHALQKRDTTWKDLIPRCYTSQTHGQYGWTGCCYMAMLKLPYEVLAVQKGKVSNENKSKVVPESRKKRDMARFYYLESYHWRINLGEKWGIGLFPWYGVTFLADHIDNITYTLQGFANETIRGFEYLSNTQRGHRLMLLKLDMARDYILAKQVGLCVALNLTEDACYTLIPNSSDNVTGVIDALKNIRDAFGSSEG